MSLDNARRKDRPQTIKQAKAAFKARGSTLVSDVDKRRLERGAQLLERASRIKEQEQRRKEQVRRREGHKEQSVKAPLLGTQRRLDKFGYKSSQFHLGAFLKAARPLTVTEEKSIAPEPWDYEDVNDDTLLDIAVESPVQQTESTSKHRPIGPTTTGFVQGSPTSCTHHDMDDWDDFLETNTQLARELSNEPSRTERPSDLHFSSFGSTDFDISAEDLEELEASCTPKEMNYPHDNSKMIMPRLPNTDSARNMDRRLMPPPSLPLPCKQQPKSLQLKDDVPLSPPMAIAPNKVVFDISLADLESLAEEDIELSQFRRD